MTEQIGNVMIDDTYYPGEDLYCDGQIEDEILEIVRTKKPEEYRKVIEERANWPIFYHLTSLRENIVNWIPIERNAKVLEIGSGCGAITGALSRKAGSVTCIDLSKKRSMINAYRHRECDNITIHIGNFTDVEPSLPCDFDYIFLIGVFEYGQVYIDSATPYEDFLKIIFKHLQKGGRLVIAIENRFGMKYFAGCKEDHTGRFFDGIENYPQGGSARTFTKNALEKLLNGCGIGDYAFYYPYPDYKFPTTIFSDTVLPKTGELHHNICNYDRDRLLLFDEQKAFDAVLEEGMFPMYANSFCVITGPAPKVKYSKFSNDRASQYAIRTDICEDATGKRAVYKYPVTEGAAAHVKNIAKFYLQLSDKYDNHAISFNRCEDMGDCVKLEYLYGETLEEKFDSLLRKNDKKAFLTLFRQFCDIFSYRAEQPVTDWDAIFQNVILPTEEGKEWTIIDYEWTFERPTDVKALAARAVYCYLLGNPQREIALQWILSEAGELIDWDMEKTADEEKGFQEFVEQGAMAACDIRNAIGHRVLSIEAMEVLLNRSHALIQIYTDTGKGFSEAESFFIEDAVTRDEVTTFSFPLCAKDRVIRIDPAMNPCAVTLISAICGNEEILPQHFKPHRSAVRLGKDTYLFPTNDPNFKWKVPKAAAKNCDSVTIRMQIEQVPAMLAEKLKKKLWR